MSDLEDEIEVEFVPVTVVAPRRSEGRPRAPDDAQRHQAGRIADEDLELAAIWRRAGRLASDLAHVDGARALVAASLGALVVLGLGAAIDLVGAAIEASKRRE